MNGLARYVPYALIALLFGVAGALAGHVLFANARSSETELHLVIHRQINLDPDQEVRIEAIEQAFLIRRTALEQALRADNVRLAEAITAEKGFGPHVAEAVDQSHMTMGALQKLTLEHIFAMRAVLRPEQTRDFDAAVKRALITPGL